MGSRWARATAPAASTWSGTPPRPRVQSRATRRRASRPPWSRRAVEAARRPPPQAGANGAARPPRRTGRTPAPACARGVHRKTARRAAGAGSRPPTSKGSRASRTRQSPPRPSSG
eukprot:5870926-Prymnesium_polylepis.2